MTHLSDGPLIAEAPPTPARAPYRTGVARWLAALPADGVWYRYAEAGTAGAKAPAGVIVRRSAVNAAGERAPEKRKWLYAMRAPVAGDQ